MKNKILNTRAFTLVELMLVIIIIGILAATVMPRLVGKSEQARATAAYSDITTNISLALDMFEMDVGRFPTTEEGLLSLRKNSGSIDNWKGPYLKNNPVDPWKNEYVYRNPSQDAEKDYDLFSKGPNGIEGDLDDILNQ